MKIKLLSAAALLCALFNGSAHAAFVTGSISFADGFDLVPSPPNLTCIIDCGTDVFDVNNAVNSYSPGSATGDFVGAASALASDIDVSALPFVMFTTDTGFSFTVTSIMETSSSALSCSGGLCNDSILYSISGVVSGGGFDDTAFSGNWTANGTCLADGDACEEGSQSGSWSSSVVALGREPEEMPIPGTLLLLGAGLFGVRLSGRRQARA
jgi:hypothetical protein